MSLTIENLALIYPEQLILEFSPEAKQQAWKQTQARHYDNAAIRWRAYQNLLCLKTFLTYIDSEPGLPNYSQVWQSENLLDLWQLVNGTAIAFKTSRLILIPQLSQENNQELRVCREWVDIPQWAGSYYLGVEINLDECWMRIWDYTTHDRLKHQGEYDRFDETYSLESLNLSEDINNLWLDFEFDCCATPKVALIPSLSPTAANNLLQRLNDPDLISLRLSLPFEQWGALISEEPYLQALYRQLNPSAVPEEKKAIALSQWISGVFSDGWQSLASLTANNNLAYGLRSSGQEDAVINADGVKLIDLGMQFGDRTVVLLVGITAADRDDRVSVRVRLHPYQGDRHLPPEINLALQSMSGKSLQQFSARTQDESIQLKRFTCKRGKGFRIVVSLDSLSIAEDFVVDSDLSS